MRLLRSEEDLEKGNVKSIPDGYF